MVGKLLWDTLARQTVVIDAPKSKILSDSTTNKKQGQKDYLGYALLWLSLELFPKESPFQSIFDSIIYFREEIDIVCDYI